MAKKRRKQTGPPGTPYPSKRGPWPNRQRKKGKEGGVRYGPIDTRSFEQSFSDALTGIFGGNASVLEPTPKVKRTKPKPGTSV
jgi:hypothetical protein